MPLFTIDNPEWSGVWEGRDTGRTWNGWACPAFSLDVLPLLVEWLNAVEDGRVWVLTDTEVKNTDCGNHQDGIACPADCEDNDSYPIINGECELGSGAWTWSIWELPECWWCGEPSTVSNGISTACDACVIAQKLEVE